MLQSAKKERTSFLHAPFKLHSILIIVKCNLVHTEKNPFIHKKLTLKSFEEKKMQKCVNYAMGI